MPQENLTRVSARALQEMAAAEYAYARSAYDVVVGSAWRECTKRDPRHAANVAAEARAARDRYLTQTAD